MVKVAVLIEGNIKGSMTTSNLGGSNPSAPGQVPNVGTGALRNSITNKISNDGLSAYVGVFAGPAAKYARRLELGFTGVDAKGRNYNQQARPFIVPQLNKSKNRIIKIIERG